MKRTAAVLLIATGSIWAQSRIAMAPVAPTPPPAPPRMSLQMVETVERTFNDTIASTRPSEPLSLIGMTRGLYLEGFGPVFTIEVDLINSPAPLIFRKIGDEQVLSTHKRKLEQVPILMQTMRNMMATAARSLDLLPENDRITLSVRLLYQSWENTNGLPNNIRMTATRKDAMNGMIKVETE